jgi:hypothetical protein
MRNFILSLLLVLQTLQVSAQFRETAFSSFPADSMCRIELQIPDSLVVHSWHNSAIFVETEVLMDGCSESTLKHTVSQGRYALLDQRQGPNMVFRPAVNRQGGLTTPRGFCTETVTYRIYLPSDFYEESPGVWVREFERNKSTINY